MKLFKKDIWYIQITSFRLCDVMCELQSDPVARKGEDGWGEGDVEGMGKKYERTKGKR